MFYSFPVAVFSMSLSPKAGMRVSACFVKPRRKVVLIKLTKTLRGVRLCPREKMFPGPGDFSLFKECEGEKQANRRRAVVDNSRNRRTNVNRLCLTLVQLPLSLGILWGLVPGPHGYWIFADAQALHIKQHYICV